METVQAEGGLPVPAEAPSEQRAIFVDKVNGQWKKTKLAALDIEKRCKDGVVYDTSIIFLTNRLEDDNIPGGEGIDEQMRLALSKICGGIPDLFWASPESRIQGFFGGDECYDENKLHEHKSWFRFMIKQLKKSKNPSEALDPKNFEWCRVMCFTHWLSSGQKRAHGPNCLDDPFWMHLSILRLIIDLWDEAIWHLQPLVKGVESSNNGAVSMSALYNAAPEAEFPKQHDILRYALHHAESSEVAVNVVEGMRDHYERLLSRMDKKDAEQMHVGRETLNRLNYELQLLSSLHIRAAAYRDRITNEITLTFHNVSQYDTRLSLEMGKQQLLDSATMRVIAVLTLVCLPFTLICAIFGTPFFSFSPEDDREERFDVSKSFWILWAIAIPISILTLAAYSKMGPAERKTGLQFLPPTRSKDPGSFSLV